MKVRQSTLLLLGCFLVLGGCQGPQHRAQLEQELRMQEDRIYQLQDCLQEARAALEACSQENEALRRKSSGGFYDEAPRHESESSGGSPELNVEMPSTNTSPGQIPKMFQGNEPSGESAPEASSLQVTPGVEAPATPAWTEPVEKPIPADTFLEKPPREGPAIDPTTRSEAATQIEVDHLALERPVDGQGISLSVVPRDEHGAPLSAPAPVSIVVVDPLLSGPEARVARWDFSPEEMASLLNPAQADEGFRLRLKWPDQGGPLHKELHLFVRYVTTDGRKLHAEMPFDLGRLAVAEPPRTHQSIARWQRRKHCPTQEQMAPPPTPRWSGPSSTAGSDAPAWGASSAPKKMISEAPPFNSPNSEVSDPGTFRDQPSQRVATRPKSPTWSPERE